jgi:type III pantothenate kinase
MSLDEIDAVCVSSVVPPLGAQFEQLSERYLDACCLTIGPGLKTGMPIRIDNPLEVGADRLVNSIAAYERFGEACVVVDFGTGINVDVVSAEGEYLGGAIGPGLEISLTALIDRAARITRIDLEAPEAAIGRSSRAAIQSGFVFGFAGMIDGIVRRIEEELPDPMLLATGGLAKTIVPFTETIDEVDDMLTLKGLRLIYERNKSTAPAD